MLRIAFILLLLGTEAITVVPAMAETLPLPPPHRQGTLSLEATIAQRHSIRSFSNQPLTLQQIAQLAWATQGITHGEQFRAAPSAGALYPLELFMVAGNVEGLEPGIYRYIPREHALQKVAAGDQRRTLAAAAYSQRWLAEAAAVFVIVGVEERTRRKYGKRAERYVYMEAGHAGENLLLQATALDLGSVIVGAFNDREVSERLGLDKAMQPISLIPVGHAKTRVENTIP